MLLRITGRRETILRRSRQASVEGLIITSAAEEDHALRLLRGLSKINMYDTIHTARGILNAVARTMRAASRDSRRHNNIKNPIMRCHSIPSQLNLVERHDHSPTYRMIQLSNSICSPIIDPFAFVGFLKIFQNSKVSFCPFVIKEHPSALSSIL